MKNIQNLFKLLVLPMAVIVLNTDNISAQKKSNKEQPKESHHNGKIKYVNPLIGTAGNGHTFPGATIPFGMVQLSPDNGLSNSQWASGYNYASDIIVGFSHTHFSGSKKGSLADISVMPMVNVVEKADIQELFSHKDEIATPGYYSVHLMGSDVKVELTASQNVGWHRYTYPQSNISSIRFDLGFDINDNVPTETYIHLENDSTIVGYRKSTGWINNHCVYFAARVNKNFIGYLMSKDGESYSSKKAYGKDLKLSVCFATEEKEEVVMKVAISYANIDGAMKALEAEKGWNFDLAHNKAKQLWENALAVIDVEGSEKDKRIFYTSLYHTYFAPTVFSDLNNAYITANGTLSTANDQYYSTLPTWDIFRASFPLMTITQPNRISDIVKSMLKFYDEHGLLPVYALADNETNINIGYHSVSIIADAILKGVKGFDYNKALEAMVASGMQTGRGSIYYRDYNYIPYDRYENSVPTTLAYSYDDWCIAQVAKKLNNAEIYEEFIVRAGFYANLFDSKTGFMRPKDSKGEWIMPFDSEYVDRSKDNQYNEENAWLSTWFVPHDLQGLVNLFGSRNAFNKKLDSLFATKPTSELRQGIMIGQYAQSNETSHHIAYLYNYSGEPWKTQMRVREIMEMSYSDEIITGLCGNEGSGQMSTWYVMSAMGIYPVDPSSGVYVFGSPILREVKIKMPSGKTFVIKTKENSKEHVYIQSVTLNGKPYTKIYITQDIMNKGGELVFTMGKTPSYVYGVFPKDVPPSMSEITK